jgi:phage-related tail fiber protein
MNTAPTGWLKANGAAVSRTTYAALFSAIGTTFGVGDGSTTFNLPDLRGEFMRGWDDGRGVDSGRAFGSAQLDQMQKITGNIVGQAFTVNLGASSSASGALSIGPTPSATASRTSVSGRGWDGIGLDSSTSPDARVSSTTSGETRARNIALLACIKF